MAKRVCPAEISFQDQQIRRWTKVLGAKPTWQGSENDGHSLGVFAA